MVIATVLLSIYAYLVLPNYIPFKFDGKETALVLRAKWFVFAFPIAAMLAYLFIQILVGYVYIPKKVNNNAKLLALYEASNSFMILMRLSVLLGIFLTLTLIIIGSFIFGNMFGLFYYVLMGISLGFPVLWYLREVVRI